MGYESKIYLGLSFIGGPAPHLSDVYETDDNGEAILDNVLRKAHYTQVVAMVDLSKAGDGPVGEVISQGIRREKARLAKGTETKPVYGYGLYVGPNEFEDQDPYADPISPLDLDALIDALEVSYALDAYRRFGIALAVLKGWRDLRADFGGPETAVVLHYGH